MSIAIEMTMNSVLTDITEDILVSGCLLRYVNGSPDYKFAPDLFDFTINGKATLLISYLITKYRRERVIVYNNEAKEEVLFEGYIQPYNDASFRDNHGNLALSATDRISIDLDRPCEDFIYREQTLLHIAQDICSKVSLGSEFPASMSNIEIPFFVRDFGEENYIRLLDTLLWEYGYTLYNKHGNPSIAAVRRWFHDIPTQFEDDKFIDPESTESISVIEPFDITEEELEHQVIAVEAKQLKRYIVDKEDIHTTGVRLYLEKSDDPTKNPVTSFNGPGVYPIDADTKITYQRYRLAGSGDRFDEDSRLLHAWDQGLYYRYLVGNTTYDEVFTEPWPYDDPYVSGGGVTPEVIEHYSKRSRVVLRSTRQNAPDESTVFQDITVNRIQRPFELRRRWEAPSISYLDKSIVGRAGDTFLMWVEIGASGDVHMRFGGTIPKFTRDETTIIISAGSKSVKFRLGSGGNPYLIGNSDARAVYNVGDGSGPLNVRFVPRYSTAIADKLGKLAALEIRGSAFVQHGIIKIRDGIDSVSVRYDAVSVVSSAGRTSYGLPGDDIDELTGDVIPGASSEDNYYRNWRLVSEFGTNLIIREYVGSTKTAIVEGIVQPGDTAGTRLSLISPALGVTEEEVQTSNIFSRDYKTDENLTFTETYSDAFNLGEGYRNLREYGRYIFKLSTYVNDKLPKIGDIYKLRYDDYGLLTTVVVHSVEYLPDDPDNPLARIILKKIGNFDPSRSYLESASVPGITEPEPVNVKSYVPNVPTLTVRSEDNNVISSWDSQPGLQNLSHHELQIAEEENGPWFPPNYTDSGDWKIGEENSFISIYGYEFIQVNMPYDSTFYYRVRRAMTDDSKSDWSEVAQADIGSRPSTVAGDVLLDEVIYAETIVPELEDNQLPDNDWGYKEYDTVNGVEWSETEPNR